VELIRPAEESRDRGATGGGYFLWWNGWRLVIDPGLGFGGASRDANYVPRKLSAVVATYHHIDHTGDMLAILNCLFEINQGPEPRGRGRHHVDFLLAPGAFSAFADVAAYVPGVRSFQLLRPKIDAPGRITSGTSW
jgi:glyoxylase-like metal-dependent hydrolase (beta-lactamase superfamily II)